MYCRLNSEIRMDGNMYKQNIVHTQDEVCWRVWELTVEIIGTITKAISSVTDLRYD